MKSSHDVDVPVCDLVEAGTEGGGTQGSRQTSKKVGSIDSYICIGADLTFLFLDGAEHVFLLQPQPLGEPA